MPETQEDPKQQQEPKQQQPQPKPQQTDPQVDPDAPWGDDENFDPSKAKSLIKNLRGDKTKLQTQLEQAAADREELETLRRERLSADEKALQDAADKAAAEAQAAADAKWGPKYLTSELKSCAAQVIKDKDDLASFMAFADPSKFVGEDGEIDEEKVMGHLTALYVGRSTRQQAPQWGQHSGNQRPPGQAGDAGRAALEKRHGVKQSS
jgi:hypothetical protein